MDGYSGAGVSESEKAKPPPRSHQPRPLRYLCSKRGGGFTKPKPPPRSHPAKAYQIPRAIPGREIPKFESGNPRPALTIQNPPIICALSGLRVSRKPSPRCNQPKPPHHLCSKRGRGFRKPWPRSNQPRPPHYLCSKRGHDFGKILVLLKKIKKINHSNHIYRIYLE